MRKLYWLVVIVAIIVTLTLLGAIVWYYTRPTTFTERKDFIDLLTKIAGGAALLISLLFTWRNLRLTQETAQATLKVTEEGKITDRFSKAIEHLGSEKLEIRLGGIYALERIAKDSHKDYSTILEVLTAFVREKGSLTGEPIKYEQKRSRTFGSPPLPIVVPETDTQAVLAAIGRLITLYGKSQPLDLSFSDLRGANLSGFSLISANFQGSSLAVANLSESKLSNADFLGADLSQANFFGADLQNAVIVDANCVDAQFYQANLCGASMWRTTITKEQISNAVMDEKTQLPRELQ